MFKKCILFIFLTQLRCAHTNRFDRLTISRNQITEAYYWSIYLGVFTSSNRSQTAILGTNRWVMTIDYNYFIIIYVHANSNYIFLVKLNT